MLFVKTKKECEIMSELVLKYADSAIFKRFANDETPQLGDFIEDLFCSSLVENVKSGITYPIIRTEKFASTQQKKEWVLKCLPDKWIDKSEFSKLEEEIKNSKSDIKISSEKLDELKKDLIEELGIKKIVELLNTLIKKIALKNNNEAAKLRKKKLKWENNDELVKFNHQIKKILNKLKVEEVGEIKKELKAIIEQNESYSNILKTIESLEECGREHYRLINLKNDTLIVSLNSLIKGNKNNYSIGRSIRDRFILEPARTKRDIYTHINELLKRFSLVIEDGVFIEYISFIVGGLKSPKEARKNLLGINDKSVNLKYPTTMSGYIGTGSYNDYVKERLASLLIDDKQHAKIISLLILDFIIVTTTATETYQEINANLAILLVWFDASEIAQLSEIIKVSDKVCEDFQYCYAQYFYEHRLYDFSYEILNRIKDTVNVPKELINYLYAQHLLLGRGCKKNVLDALKKLQEASRNNVKQSVEITSWKRFVALETKTIIDGTKEKIIRIIERITNGDYGEVPNLEIHNKNLNTQKKQSDKNITNIFDFLQSYQYSNIAKRIDLPKSACDVRCCVTNNKNAEEVYSFAMSLDEYKMLDFYNDEHLGLAIKTAMDNIKVDILLFSEDESKNIDDCLNLVERLCLIDDNSNLYRQINIYIKADFDYASLLIDSSLNVNDCFFRIHICDPKKMTAQKLLIDAPLYIPCLINNSDIDVVVLGANQCTLELAKEIVATTYTRDVPKLTVLGNNADYYRKKLIQSSPGIYKEPSRLDRIIPKFYECNIENIDFIDLLTNAQVDQNLNNIRKILQKGTYFVVDLGNDKDNILFATKLRGWLLSCDKSFSRAPFIAVKCESGQNAKIAKNLVVNNKTAGNNFYNNYNLYFYGMKEDVFSGEYLDMEKNPKKQMALNIHLAYLEENSTVAEIESAIKNYFKFSYNRDSSECAAISLTYMFYYLGMIKKIEDLKLNNKALSEKYEEWIKDEPHLKSAERYEHSRWVGYMLSRGWQSATLEQVEAYAGQESGAHKHLLCRLHPFICNWDDFSDDTEESVKINALKNAINGLNSPTKSTNKIVSAIDKILTNNPFAYKELEIDESR